MGTIRSVAGWAIVTAFATGGCSTGPKETDVAGSEVGKRNDNGKTEQSYVAVDPSSEATSVPSAAPRGSESSDFSGDGASSGGTSAETDGGTSFTPPDESSSAAPLADAGDETLSTAPTSSSAPSTSGASETSETILEPTCHETAGLCDPVGDCALSDCDFEESGKSCSYTPDRTYPFMCVGSANYEPYRPCDADDVCAPGSVCISKVALLKDGSFYRRPGAVCRETCRQDADCGEGEWCAQATDDNNEVIPDLRVCHRHCSTVSDCYVGEGDEEVRCSNAVEGAPPSTYECSRYRPPADVAPVEELVDGVAQTITDGSASVAETEPLGAATHIGSSSTLALHAYRALAVAATCVFHEDCPADADCVNGTCQARCDTDDDCDGSECVVVDGRGVCGAPCEKPPGAACGLLPSNCGCAVGETCHLDGSFEPTCSKPGRSRTMDWCNKAEDCDTGLSCIAGLCRPLCAPDTHPCNAVDGECLLSVSREAGDVYACAGSCDPVAAPECGVGAVCLPGFDSKHHQQALCVAERAAQRPRAVGETCTEDYDCETGLGCAENGTCRSWCRTRDDCAEDETCKFDASIMGSGVARFGGSVDDAVGLCQD